MKIRDFSSDEEIHALVTAFESGDLPKADFKHCAHIAVAMAYLSDAPLEEATQRMRSSLRKFVGEENAGVLHETVTVFWMKLLHHLALVRYPHLALWERVNAAVASHGTSWPMQAHYSKEALASPKARQQWLEPDRLPLPF